APGALPASSFTSKRISGLLNSASAISDALRMDCAATLAFPVPDSGRMKPTFTVPVPMLVDGCAGVLGEELDSRSASENPPVPPEQAARRIADVSRTSDRKPRASGSRKPCNTRNITAGLLDGANDVTVNESLQQAFYREIIRRYKELVDHSENRQ